MGDVVNLRRARKARDRGEKENAAQANRVAFGRTKAERALTEAERRLAAAKLDAHRLEKPEEPA
jgi:hypothetical protein